MPAGRTGDTAQTKLAAWMAPFSATLYRANLAAPAIPWAGRVWGLPFLTALAPSERYAGQRQKRHKKLAG